ncbi:MAG: Sulfofructose kinase [Alphaproteobacteria bacterium MarineAlpha5_Bin5]|nr:MAG: Sulfofructose kinase [Alphaproteobacteria bacterium MarineAlpha5_Bin5]PPR51444.1 MAG: Sulfofructose kinase [Alphaproteobacteria bacterium MarineAlpha5_Bin4]|tara:strand:- start:1473 stop:2378 length:906 start_codon:yes stop_codon:yes gene_type:complete
MIYSVGSIFLDHIIKIKSFPKTPVKVFAQGIEKRLGGSAAVASFTIKKLGTDASFIGRLGDDDISKYLIAELSKFNIKHNNLITVKGAQSSQSYVYEDKQGERFLAAFSEKKLLNNKKIPKISFKKNTTFISDLRWIKATLYVAKHCNKNNLKHVVDLDNYELNSRVKKIIDLSSYPIFSEPGAFEFTKTKSIIGSLKKMYSIKNKFYAITAGKKGVYWIENGFIFNCKPPKIKVVETNCAGDVFHGAFAAFIHQKHSIIDSMKLATATASLKCTKNGGIYSIPSYSSVRKFVKKIQLRKL